MRKRLITVVSMTMALLMVAGLAYAQEATTDAAEPADSTEANGTVLHGRGKLWAKGTGTALMEVHGKVRMRIKGDVVIEDIAGDATIRIADGPWRTFAEEAGDSTTIVLENFNGAVYVRGSHFKLDAHGRMAFVAKGKGRVYLEGDGVWRTRRNRGVWSQGGTDFVID